MTVKKFLDMYRDAVDYPCITIRQLPCTNNQFTNTYFEEELKEDVISSETFKKIKNLKIDHFNVIGGGMYINELCIYLKA